MSFFSTRALVKKVSQKGDEPAINLIGRGSTPGWCISISSQRIPSCFFDGSVRTRQKHQSARCAPLVQIFCPFTTQ